MLWSLSVYSFVLIMKATILNEYLRIQTIEALILKTAIVKLWWKLVWYMTGKIFSMPTSWYESKNEHVFSTFLNFVGNNKWDDENSHRQLFLTFNLVFFVLKTIIDPSFTMKTTIVRVFHIFSFTSIAMCYRWEL